MVKVRGGAARTRRGEPASFKTPGRLQSPDKAAHFCRPRTECCAKASPSRTTCAHKIVGVPEAIETRGCEISVSARLLARPQPRRAGILQAASGTAPGRGRRLRQRLGRHRYLTPLTASAITSPVMAAAEASCAAPQRSNRPRFASLKIAEPNGLHLPCQRRRGD